MGDDVAPRKAFIQAHAASVTQPRRLVIQTMPLNSGELDDIHLADDARLLALFKRKSRSGVRI